MSSTVAIRTDASLVIGTGHVMRCLTLAHALRASGSEVYFICRLLEGQLCDRIEAQGFVVIRLPAPTAGVSGGDAWLGVPWEIDAQQALAALHSLPSRVDWLVVDHYALDEQWERMMAPVVARILVIDDLADRRHVCTLLLDQNLGRARRDYEAILPAGCPVLVGPAYALLRPEFAAQRTRSLARVRWPLSRILVSLGGVDRTDATSAVLDALDVCPYATDAEVEVIMGLHSPWLGKVMAKAAQMQRATVHVNVDNMAERMANSDLAIGAAGATSWERCCLGLPALVVVLADNQRPGALAMDAAGVQRLLGDQNAVAARLPTMLTELEGQAMARMSREASTLVDGRGVQRVLEAMDA